MDVEAVVLNGGSSRRMGQDKGSIEVEGVPLERLIADRLATVCDRVTFLGKAVEGYPVVADADPSSGPLVALAGFTPQFPRVFAASCDLVRFDPRVVGGLAGLLAEHDAVVPVVEGRTQPLCALYVSEAFALARELALAGERRMSAWMDRLDCFLAPYELMIGLGIDPLSVTGANTPAELDQLKSSAHVTGPTSPS